MNLPRNQIVRLRDLQKMQTVLAFAELLRVFVMSMNEVAALKVRVGLECEPTGWKKGKASWCLLKVVEMMLMD